MSERLECKHVYAMISCTKDKWTYKCAYCGAIHEVTQYDERERAFGWKSL